MSVALGPEPLVSNRDTPKRISPSVSAPKIAFCLSETETPPARVMTPIGFTKQFPIFQIAFWGYATVRLCHVTGAYVFTEIWSTPFHVIGIVEKTAVTFFEKVIPYEEESN
jgi:hypothetical protein